MDRAHGDRLLKIHGVADAEVHVGRVGLAIVLHQTRQPFVSSRYHYHSDRVKVA